MKTPGKKFWAGISLFLLGAASLVAQEPAPANPPESATPQATPASSAPDHARAYYHYMLARRFKELAGMYNRADYIDRAISEYKQAMEADPESLFLRVELAQLYGRVNRIGEAIREAEAVLNVNPDYAEAHRVLAHIYVRNLGDNQPEKTAKESLHKAIEHYEALARVDPSDTESYVVLGRLYKLNNEPAKAEEVFRKVLNSDPGSKSALTNLVQLFLDQGDADQAVELLKKIPEDEMDVSLLGMLGYASSQARDFDAAVAAYEKALAQDPENQDLRRAYAEALSGKGNTAAARAEFQKILKAEPDDGSLYLRLAQLDRMEGRFEDARRDLEKARTLMPDNLEIPYHQVLLEDAVGNQDKAVEILQDLLKRAEKPDGKYSVAEANNQAIFYERLGLIYRTQEKFDEAISTFRKIVALGKNQAPRGEALIVETLRLNRQPKKALEEVEAAIQSYPDDRPLHMLRASILGEQGRLDDALRELQAFLKGAPADRETHLAMAQVYSQAKRYPEAEEAIRKSLALSPRPDDQEYALFMLGSVFERQKKFDQAEEQFKKVLAVNPLNAAASNYLGYMLADRGVRLEESLKYIQKALTLEPNNGAYLDSLGWAYFKMKRFDLAEPPLTKAAHLVSSDPTIHEHLGHVYFEMGNKARAQEEWERALKAWPTAVSSDFDAEQAAKLQKQLDDLKRRTGKDKPAKR